MDLVFEKDLEQDSGSRFIPDTILQLFHPDALSNASAAYAKMVADHPNYEFGMVHDSVKGGLTIYWKRLV